MLNKHLLTEVFLSWVVLMRLSVYSRPPDRFIERLLYHGSR